jgi:hypothetical protein
MMPPVIKVVAVLQIQEDFVGGGGRQTSGVDDPVDAHAAFDGQARSRDRSEIEDRIGINPCEPDGRPGLRQGPDGALVGDDAPVPRQIEAVGLAGDGPVRPDQDVIRPVRPDAGSGAAREVEIDDGIIASDQRKSGFRSLFRKLGGIIVDDAGHGAPAA